MQIIISSSNSTDGDVNQIISQLSDYINSQNAIHSTNQTNIDKLTQENNTISEDITSVQAKITYYQLLLQPKS